MSFRKSISIKSALVGGVWATFAVSAMMLMNNATGAFPELHVARTLSTLLGAPGHVMVGWGVHFLLGTVVFGSAFAVLAPRIPVRSNLVKGLAFGFLMWLGMMTVFMPLGGSGFFGATRGSIVPIAGLVLNLVYGLILSAVYGLESASLRKVAGGNR